MFWQHNKSVRSDCYKKYRKNAVKQLQICLCTNISNYKKYSYVKYDIMCTTNNSF